MFPWEVLQAIHKHCLIDTRQLLCQAVGVQSLAYKINQSRLDHIKNLLDMSNSCTIFACRPPFCFKITFLPHKKAYLILKSRRKINTFLWGDDRVHIDFVPFVPFVHIRSLQTWQFDEISQLFVEIQASDCILPLLNPQARAAFNQYAS